MIVNFNVFFTFQLSNAKLYEFKQKHIVKISNNIPDNRREKESQLQLVRDYMMLFFKQHNDLYFENNFNTHYPRIKFGFSTSYIQETPTIEVKVSIDNYNRDDMNDVVANQSYLFLKYILEESHGIKSTIKVTSNRSLRDYVELYKFLEDDAANKYSVPNVSINEYIYKCK